MRYLYCFSPFLIFAFVSFFLTRLVAGLRREAGCVRVCDGGGQGAGRVLSPAPGLLPGHLQCRPLPHLQLPLRPHHRPPAGVRGASGRQGQCM